MFRIWTRCSGTRTIVYTLSCPMSLKANLGRFSENKNRKINKIGKLIPTIPTKTNIFLFFVSIFWGVSGVILGWFWGVSKFGHNSICHWFYRHFGAFWIIGSGENWGETGGNQKIQMYWFIGFLFWFFWYLFSVFFGFLTWGNLWGSWGTSNYIGI